VYSAEEAVAEIDQFYSNFHSSRWLKNTFVIRMHHALNEPALRGLHEKFSDLSVGDGFQQYGHQDEYDEAQFSHLTRLAFKFNGRNHGRLRELVDFVNLKENWAGLGHSQSALDARPVQSV
jgi:hypothetical protein